ncbi:MAG: hypothetical protein ACI88H_004225 [Cocleimonas sp.]|jgi:hypothetical protein
MNRLNKKIPILLLAILLFILFGLKASDEIEILAQYEMLACENCDHMMVIRSNKKELVGESIIPIAEKQVIESVIDFSIGAPEKLVCIKGRLFLLDYSFGLIDPKGKKFHIDSFGEEKRCLNLLK